MSTKFSCVKGTKHNEVKPCIRIGGDWLAEIGFTKNTLLQLECSKDFIWVKLCKTASLNHCELSKNIRKKDEHGIFCVYSDWRKNGTKSPYFYLSGFWLEKFGFLIGDYIAIRYEYGIVKIKKLEIDDM